MGSWKLLLLPCQLAGMALLAARPALAPPVTREARAAQLEVALELRAPMPPAPAQIELVLHGEGPGHPMLKRVATIPRFPLVLDLDEGLWTAEVKAPGLWASARSVVVRPSTRHRVRIELYPLAAASGRVEVERGEVLPGELGVELYQPVEMPGPRNPRPHHVSSEALTLRCPVAGGGFQCAVPAGLWDVRVRAPRYVSSYLWNRRFTPGMPASLGTLRLRRGASVVGWVRVDGPVRKGTECVVTLKPMVAGASSASQAINRALSLSARADERGFFSFAAVPPGAYVLTAAMTGFAATEFFPLRVFEDKETQAQEPLVLKPPVPLRVRISPPTELEQQPWGVEVFKLGNTPGTMEQAAHGTAAPDGTWHVDGLPMGRFLVRVNDAKHSPWAFQEIELPSTSEADFDLDFVQVRGTLRLGGEPLAATLFFGGKFGVPRFRMASDGKGRFEGNLSKEGTWRIDVEARDPLVGRSLQVEVRRPRGKTVAKLELDLPDGRLQGKVTDENQHAVQAMVMVTTEGASPVSLPTDGNGEFSARGFASGPVILQAEARGDESDMTFAQVDEKVGSPPVHLVLKKKRDAGGWVLGPSGSVPGAMVIAWGPGQLSSQAVTDQAGHFSLRVPAAAAYLDVEVMAPGYSLQARRVRLAEEDLRLVVDPDGGTLVLEGLKGLAGETLVAQNGAPIPLPTLVSWAMGNGERPSSEDRLVVPLVEAGQYEVCRIAFSHLPAYLRGNRPAERCAAGALAVGGKLTLRVPGR
jgi:hypothetical protein